MAGGALTRIKIAAWKAEVNLMLSNGRWGNEETKQGEWTGTSPASHINYVQDVARCKCNTNWTGPLIIIHWRHLLAYLTVLRLSSSFLVPLDFFHVLQSLSLFLFSFFYLCSSRALDRSRSFFRFDRRALKREFVVDYYLLNATAETVRDAFKSRSFTIRGDACREATL